MKKMYPLALCFFSALSLGGCGQTPTAVYKPVPLKEAVASGPPPVDKSYVTYAKLLPEHVETRVRMSQISLALTRYCAQHGGKMPNLSSPQTMQRALAPYLHQSPIGGKGIFYHSVTKKSFVPNPSLSHVVFSKISNPASVCLVYEAFPSSDGTRGVVFADGLVNDRFGSGSFRRVRARDWIAIKKQSHIK